jgi:hypothetical protein
LQTDQLLRRRSYPIDVIAGPPRDNPHVAAIGPTQARKRLSEPRDASLRPGIVFLVRHEHADPPHAPALLRTRRDRPSRRAAECGDEVAPSKANAHLPLLCRELYGGENSPSLWGLPHRLLHCGISVASAARLHLAHRLLGTRGNARICRVDESADVTNGDKLFNMVAIRVCFAIGA